ncbi:DUF3108 domain-containing protein [Massilia sp. PAMC28688]|uniref:DUF3108 domain-containing protein n=1 Tax=Massilia sp. PAMC28688 TaxID=2861283 RepID=UPI001C624C8C|nr:DUF3108 domain-containing protein [Massilia sp. PAMC28688]QYF94698.1 DUF3108 domain-containing protein [Massilia sp. PAMC28688]
MLKFSVPPPIADAGGARPASKRAQKAPVAAPGPARAQPSPPAPSDAAARRGYRVSLPPSADLAFAVTRVEAGGARWSGEGEMRWQWQDDGYRLHSLVQVAREQGSTVVELSSEGTVGEGGMAPRRMAEKRPGRAWTATHFDHGRGRITFSASQAQAALAAGAQDSASLVMQLAGIARAGSAQLEQGVRILVATAREAREFDFVVTAQEEIETEMGRIAAWRLARPVPPGSYNALLELWLAPDQHWYPVQLRSTEANGTVTTQTVRRIVIKEN